jgi:SAM-dependent methyltransferase
MSWRPEYDVVVDPTAENNPHAAALRLVGGGAAVLEVGCWSGYVTEHLVAAGNRVVGVELDAGAAQRAERFAERVHVADIDVTPLSTLEPGPFDVVLFGDVLEHLRDPAATLADAGTLLAPDGRFVISVPHVAHVDVRMMLLQGTWEYQDDGLLDRTHLRWFTREGLRSLLADAGFVATAIERVRTPYASSNLPFDRDAVPHALLAYAAADDEAYTLQFVVEAKRRGETDQPDVLIREQRPVWPPIDGTGGDGGAAERRVAELEHERDALQAEVDAWRNSKLARAAAPLRSVYARLRRR